MWFYRLGFALVLILTSSACSFTIRPFVGGSLSGIMATRPTYSTSLSGTYLDNYESIYFNSNSYGLNGQFDVGFATKGVLVYFGYSPDSKLVFTDKVRSYGQLEEDRETFTFSHSAILGLRVRPLDEIKIFTWVQPTLGVGIIYNWIRKNSRYSYTYRNQRSDYYDWYFYQGHGLLLEGGFLIKATQDFDLMTLYQFKAYEYNPFKKHYGVPFGHYFRSSTITLGLIYYLNPL